MVKLKYFIFMVIGVLFMTSLVSATQEQIRVEMNEYVDQKVVFNPLRPSSGSLGIWTDEHENRSHLNLTGYIVVTNYNPNGKTISDIYVDFDHTTNMTLPTYYEGRNGTFIENMTSSGKIRLHIPELEAGENSTFKYSINHTNIRPPVNFTSNYSVSKILAGDNITVEDTIQNDFDNALYQTNTCIYDINVTQNTVPINFSGLMQDYYFSPMSISGSDASNISFSNMNKTQFWNVSAGNCLNKGSSLDINYVVNTPYNIPKTTHYKMINSTIKYKMNNTVSHLRVSKIKGISEANIPFEKKIMYPSHPTLHGSNVTWNVTGYFNTNTNISYRLEEATMWVSQRQVSGNFTDPNTVDNDTIDSSLLEEISNPDVIVNSSSPWKSSSWLFNYTDVPSPIVWMDVNFTIDNDGTQLMNRSITRNGDDIYVKEIYMIIGYWLEIDKNITSIGNDSYHVKIDVHNKGNQVTPANSIVTIYDFIPGNYNLSSPFAYSSSGWYNTVNSSNNVAGNYNGTLHQWALIPTNSMNTSFAQGPGFNQNNTWSVDYNVTGQGDYKLMDVFVTGLDPQKVDGAGATNTVVVSEVIDRIKSTEGIFASIAGILLLLGLLL